MSDQRQLGSTVLAHIAIESGIPMAGLLTTMKLLDEGGTVPFIARYRKEATGNLDEVAIGAVQEKLAYYRELEDRRETILSTIGEQGKLTDELRGRIEGTFDRTLLEDLYLPYKPKRRTKAMIARERGLEPLAEYLWNQVKGAQGLHELASSLTDPSRDVHTVENALEGARHIVAEQISENADFRSHLRQLMLTEGMVVSRAVDGAQDPEGKFKMYIDYQEPVAKIPSHRMLAIRRGSNENQLYFQIELDNTKAITYLKNKVVRADGDWRPQLEMAVEDSWRRLLNLSIQTEVRMELKTRAETEAIRVFRENLQNLLLSAPAGSIGVLGIDPGIRTGCKLAVVDNTGRFLHHGVIYPLEPRNDVTGASRTLAELLQRFSVKAIAIGNGTGSRETAAFVLEFLREQKRPDVFSVTVNESGASVYSASEIARQEFPELDLTVRGAISIARRLQDPLAELVKIDPKSIGVGQYQHDVDQKRLGEALGSTVESCVNRVGVDLNTASFALLRYVAGINERTAIKIVEFRNDNGPFRSRVSLRAVPGFGPKTFEQAAGFLRIRQGENPLDMTAVHPESYAVVERIAASLGVTIDALIAQPALMNKLKIEEFQDEKTGLYTLRDIQEELRKPGRDPREKFVAPQFAAGINEIADLTPGMIVEGVVTNVTAFGAFVDVGVHQDGLVHVSELSARFVKDPNEAVKVGQIVRVKVLSADAKAKRIALSIKALQQADLPKVKHGGGAQRPPQRPEPPSMDDKLAALSSRFRTR